jgi:hypothetical protein
VACRTFAILAACLLAMAPIQAAAANAELQADVPAGKTRVLRLRELPANAAVALRVESSGRIGVIFVHQNGLQRRPDRPRPLFSGSAERRLTFRISIPAAGTYYVILDNRKGSEAREVRVFIDARQPRPREPAPQKQRREPGFDET